jgi:uncharacterized protein (TIGR02598 family)
MKQRSKSQAGFSLVEVVIAIGVTAFCLIPISGLLLVGTHTTQNSGQQAAAVNIGSEVVADLEAADSAGNVSFSTSDSGTPYSIVIPTAASTTPQTIYMDENGNASGTVSSTSRYLVSLGFTPPPAGQRGATMVRILVTWPAQAQNTAGEWPTLYQGSWETVTALDRN